MNGLIPLDDHGRTLVALAAGVANFLTILAVLRAWSPKDLVTARARRHARRRRELRAERLAPKRSGGRRGLSYAKTLVERLRLDQGDEARKVAEQLVQAGWRAPDAAKLFLAIRLVSPMAAGFAAYVFAPWILRDLANANRVLISAGAMLAGAYLPTLLLKNAIGRRQQALLKGLPDGIDLLVICAEAGLSLDATLSRVSREIGGGCPELADELGLTVIELSFLPDRREALANLAKRTGMPQLKTLVSTLAQAERYGTPLAQALRVLAAEFRDTRLMKAEEKAARLPATLTVPLIAFILPPLFVVLIGPAVIQVLKTNWG